MTSKRSKLRVKSLKNPRWWGCWGRGAKDEAGKASRGLARKGVISQETQMHKMPASSTPILTLIQQNVSPEAEYLVANLPPGSLPRRNKDILCCLNSHYLRLHNQIEMGLVAFAICTLAFISDNIIFFINKNC